MYCAYFIVCCQWRNIQRWWCIFYVKSRKNRVELMLHSNTKSATSALLKWIEWMSTRISVVFHVGSWVIAVANCCFCLADSRYHSHNNANIGSVRFTNKKDFNFDFFVAHSCARARPSYRGRVLPSVRLFVTRRCWLKTNVHRIICFSLSVSAETPVFFGTSLNSLAPCRRTPCEGFKRDWGR